MHLLRLVLLASFLTALAGISQAQDAKNKKAAASGAAVVEGKTLGNGTFTGMVKDPPSDGRLMIRQIPAPPVAAVQPKLKGKSGAAQGNQKVDATQYAFTVDDKAKILFHVLPEAFDDKGEIMRPTADQLQKMRSGGLPGKLDQIRAGMVVRVTQASQKVTRVEVMGEADQPLSKQTKTPAPKKK
jgi:hypothetical protein